MILRSSDSRGSALPAALFLAAMLALVGAALHLAVQTEMQLAINCLESDRVRVAALSALRGRSAQLRQALARFRLPEDLTEADAQRYLNDVLSGEPDRYLSLLAAGIPGLEADFGPWTLELPLEGVRMEALGSLARCGAACLIEPAGVSGSPAAGLAFTYRCRVTGEGRSSSPGPARGGVAYCREESLFVLILARFPRCHWQLCLPGGGDEPGGPLLHLPPLNYHGPVRTWGTPGFTGTGRPRSGLPRFRAAYLTPRDDRAFWSLTSSADPQFAAVYPCRVKAGAPLPPPGDLARASLGLPPGPGPQLGDEELLEALGLPAGIGRPPAGIYLLRDGDLTGGIYVEGDLSLLEIRGEGQEQVLVLEPAAGSGRVEVRVDLQQQNTLVDGTVYPGPLGGPVFVEGCIHSLGTGAPGGGPVPPALAPGYMLTVAASGDMVVRGHLVYSESPRPFPDPRAVPPADGRLLGLYSAGVRADGTAAGGLGLVLAGPPAGRLRLDAVLAVGGEGRGIRLPGDGGEGGGVSLFGAVSVEGLVQPRLLSRLTVVYDSRLADTAFHPPGWPVGSGYEAYLASWEVHRREEISPYG